MFNRATLQETNWIDAKVYVGLSKSHQFKLTNHRKIPSSKYSGRYTDFTEDTSTPLGNHTFCFYEATPTEEEIEPP